MVWEVDESPSSVSQASATPEYEYDQSIVAVAEVPALSPRSALPARYPLTALLVVQVKHLLFCFANKKHMVDRCIYSNQVHHCNFALLVQCSI